ncbi:MAG: LEPR-XLL domain-containing protein, partial [Sedimentisphaerales bacterium]|nr:LEPR-XLL domain-containing protein [Sedimentisphaerales bacterium]
MSLLRKLRRNFFRSDLVSPKEQRRKPCSMKLEALEPRVLLSSDLYGGLLNLPVEAEWNDTISVNALLCNGGDTDISETFDVVFRISDDATVDGSDTLLTTTPSPVNIAGLTADNSTSQAVSIDLPASGTDGTFYLGMFIDDGAAVTESNETNNIVIGTIDISTATTPVVDLEAGQEDLLPTGVDLVWGQQYEIPVDLENIGDTDVTAPFTVSVVLSVDTTYDGGDSLLGEITIPGLPEGMDYCSDLTITLPASGTNGTNYVLLAVDSVSFDTGGEITEDDEGNNLYSQTVNIPASLQAGIDLVPLFIDMEPLDDMDGMNL